VSQSSIQLYYKNVTADVIGKEHGITAEQFSRLADETTPKIQKINKKRTAGETPYRDLPYNTSNVQQVKELTSDLQENCENLVILGIGGSALGNIALQTALNPFMYNLHKTQRSGPRLFVFDNIDPDQLSSFIEWLDDKIENTIFNVISKSGKTAETAAQFLIFKEILSDRLGSDALQNHIVATTDSKQGTLRKIADHFNLPSLEVPDGVGGRFGILSSVGLFSASMCGIDIDLLLNGARDMDKKVSTEDFFKNPAAVNAAVNYHYYNNGKNISVMFPYSYALKDLADWYRQLWAESLGKANDLNDNKVHVGPTPVKALGTTDQHSQVQLYREGPNNKLFTFLQNKHFNNKLNIAPAPQCAPELKYLQGNDLADLFNAEKTATEFALIKDKRPSLTVLFDKLDPYTVGQFIYLYEVTTSIAGELFNINTYNQPAVELGKKATFALMGKEEYKNLADEIKPLTKLDNNFLV